MKQVLESLRNGERQVVLPELTVRDIDSNVNLETKVKPEAVTDFSFWDWYYPRYVSIGASVFNVEGGAIYSVPSLAFDATTVEKNADVLEGTKNLNLADVPPKRVGVQISLQKELVASMTDAQLIAFIKAGAQSVHEEIFKNLVVEALDLGTHTVGGLNADGMVGLEQEVNDHGQYFGGSKALTGLKSVVANGDYLVKGNVHDFARSFSGMWVLGSKKIPDTTIIGFGNFQFSAVVLYGGLTIIRDDVTSAKTGKSVFTFSQLSNVGIIDASKFATTAIAAPVITDEPMGASRSISDTLILSVNGYGASSYVWKLDGNIIPTDVIIGADVVVNGDFATDTIWAKGALATIAAGVGTFTASADADFLVQAAMFEVGKRYKVSYDISGYVAGDVKVVGLDSEIPLGANGSYSQVGTATSIDLRIQTIGASTSLSIDNVKVEEVSAEAIDNASKKITIPNTSAVNAGTYTVELTNGIGTTVSADAVVTIT